LTTLRKEDNQKIDNIVKEAKSNLGKRISEDNEAYEQLKKESASNM
jgi:hypothetical protein